MSYDLSTVQLNSARTVVKDDAVTAKTDGGYLAAQAAAQQTALQNQWSNCIANWLDVTDPLAENAETVSMDFPINSLIDSGVLDGWETDLTGRGYGVVRSGNMFTVSIL